MKYSLRTPRLHLRPLAEGDRRAFVAMHEASAAFLRPWVPARSADESLDAFFDRERAKAERDAASGTAVRLAGFLEDGRIGGFFSLGEIVRGVFQNAYAGWSVSALVARQGVGSEGVRALLDLAFASEEQGGLGLHRVQANIIPANEPSLRLAARVGFRREGVAERYLKIAGVWQDHVMHAITAEEHRPEYFPVGQ